MDKKALVDSDIKAGAELVKNLDEGRFPFAAALWLFEPDAGDWRFFIATELVDTIGPRKTYQRLRRFLVPFREPPTLTATGLTAHNVTVVPPSHGLIAALGRVVKTGPGPGVSHIRLTENVVNGVFVEDAYVYRLHLPRSRAGTAQIGRRKAKRKVRKSRAG